MPLFSERTVPWLFLFNYGVWSIIEVDYYLTVDGPF